MFQVGVIGRIVGYDYILAESVLKNGLSCVVFRPHDKNGSGLRDYCTRKSSFSECLGKENIYLFKTPLDLFRQAKKCRLIIDINLGLLSGLRHLFFLRFLPFFPPIINLTTGSDIMELIAQKRALSCLYRFHLKTSSLTWTAPYPHALKNLIRYKIFNAVFLRYPYYLERQELTGRKPGEEIIFFHPSHLDWKVNDPGAHRVSAKGSDRFIRAFIRAVREGLKAKCVILYRGSDRDEAKKIIRAERMEDFFIWKGHLTRDELFQQYADSDVVVDQFDVGGVGMISCEAMSVGKPVLVYLHQDSARLLYGQDLPPILNCSSEDEIYSQIIKCGDRDYIKQKGEECRAWVFRNHDGRTCMDDFLFYYSLITGDTVKDYVSVKPCP
ncbi:MAG TPA: glycosyltransferase [archaeon]|nr:glycosyltransferase [archaeon]